MGEVLVFAGLLPLLNLPEDFIGHFLGAVNVQTTKNRVESAQQLERGRGVRFAQLTGVQAAIEIPHGVEQGRQRRGNIEIVLEPRSKLLLGVAEDVGAGIGRLSITGGLFQSTDQFVHAVERGPCVVAFAQREVKSLPIVSAQQHPAHLAAGISALQDVAQRMEIAGGFGHLFAVHDQVSAVQPVAHEGFPVGGFALSNLVVVMREHVVDPAGMNIEAGAEILHAHGAAFDVPAGAPFAPGAVPGDIAVLLVPGFPEREVRGALFGVFVLIDSRAGAHLIRLNSPQFAVTGEFADGKVYAPVVGLVGEALVHERADQLDHLRNVIGGGGIHFGALDAQLIQILEKSLLVGFGEVLQGYACGAGVADGFIVHVGEVHDLFDLVAGVAQGSAQQIFKHIGAEIADVSEVVDGGTAGVESNLAVLDRLEDFGSTGQRIVKADSHIFSPGGIQEARAGFLTDSGLTANKA